MLFLDVIVVSDATENLQKVQLAIAELWSSHAPKQAERGK